MEGHAIIVCLNEVDQSEYDDDLRLKPAEKNLELVSEYLTKKGFEIYSYLGKEAVSSTVLGKVEELELIEEDSHLIFYFSGHGFKPNENVAHHFSDKTEFFSFYNEMVIDIELHNRFARLGSNFKITVIIDSCYGGGFGNDLGWFSLTRRQFKKFSQGYNQFLSYERATNEGILVSNFNDYLERYQYEKSLGLTYKADSWLFASSSAMKKTRVGFNNQATTFTQLLFAFEEAFEGNYYALATILNGILKNSKSENKHLSGGLDSDNRIEFFKTHKPFNLNKNDNLKNEIIMEWKFDIDREYNKPIEVKLNPTPNQFKYIDVSLYKLADSAPPAVILNYANSVFPNELELEYVRVIEVRSGEYDIDEIIVDKNTEPLYCKQNPVLEEDNVKNGLLVVYDKTTKVVVGGKPIKGEVKNELG